MPGALLPIGDSTKEARLRPIASGSMRLRVPWAYNQRQKAEECRPIEALHCALFCGKGS